MYGVDPVDSKTGHKCTFITYLDSALQTYDTELGRSTPRLAMLRIISGAQTGVDRAALDTALRNNVPCGGWCPRGRKAEDGIIPKSYPVHVLNEGGYDERTKKNVQDSDGTIIIYFGKPSGGTEKTLLYCLNEKKPYLLLDGREVDTSSAAERIIEFISMLAGGTLNFAGPRASEEPRAYEYTSVVINKFLQLYEL